MSPRTVPIAAAALALAAMVAACGAQSPEDRVTALRAEYDASLNSFQVRERPVEPPPERAPVEEAAAGPPGAGPIAGEGEAGEAAETAPPPEQPEVRQDVVLDIVIHNRSGEQLPGITLDVAQADAQGEAKASYRIWADTSDIAPGSRGAVTHRLEDVDYAPGDGFHVEVRQAIPPEQRGEYRELSEIGEQP